MRILLICKKMCYTYISGMWRPEPTLKNGPAPHRLNALLMRGHSRKAIIVGKQK